MKKISLVVIVLFLSSLLLAGCSIRINGEEVTSFDVSVDGGNAAEKTEAMDIPVDAQNSLSVSNVKGEIVFKQWDKNQLHVNVVKKIRAGGNKEKLDKYLEQIKVEVNPNASVIEISVKYVQGLWGASSQNVSLEVMVPEGMKTIKGNEASGRIKINDFKGLDQMEIVSVSGSVEVEDIAAKSYEIGTTSGSGEVRNITGNGSVHTISGSINMEGLDGDVSAKTMSGSIEGNNMNGVFTGSSVSGQISLETGYLKADSKAHTISGSIYIHADKMDANGNYKFDSTSGSINLELPQNAGFQLDASSISGSVDCEFDVTVQGSHKRNKLEGTVGSGGADVEARTISGGININQSN